LPGVNQAGNQDTSGRAATVTSRTIGGVAFDASADIVPNTINMLDDENTNAERLVLFADGDGANQPKNDGDFKYNPSTGTLSATRFVGSGAGLSGVVADSAIETVSTKTANYNLDESSETILLGNAQSGDFSFTLPAASGKSGVMFKIKKIDASANKVQIKPQLGEKLEFVTNFVAELASQGSAVNVVCNGTDWFLM
jgi:hypothetical protein